MIYQSNDEFKVFKFKVTYSDTEELINDKEEFEHMLLENLQIEEEHKAYGEGREPSEVSLPTITYEDINLTEEQQERYDEIASIKGLTLDEVSRYVVNGVEPKNPHYQVIKLQKENQALRLEMARSNTETFEVIMSLLNGGSN